jgi:hypothetical protein
LPLIVIVPITYSSFLDFSEVVLLRSFICSSPMAFLSNTGPAGWMNPMCRMPP